MLLVNSSTVVGLGVSESGTESPGVKSGGLPSSEQGQYLRVFVCFVLASKLKVDIKSS